MTPESIFQICSNIAMLGWLVIIILSPFWQGFDKFLIAVIITLFAIIYAWLIFQSFNPGDFQKFGSLSGVMELFGNKTALTAGWVHYLAFDLFVGIWIKKNGVRHHIPHALLIPCFLFTFMLGPVGLLLYLLIRFAYTRHYFSGNYQE